jgi:hypothetical protein
VAGDEAVLGCHAAREAGVRGGSGAGVETQSRVRGRSVDVRPEDWARGRDAKRVRRGGQADARERRDLLRRAMEAEGFIVEPNEWWHFNYKDWKAYPILDIAFSEIKAVAPR